MSAAKFKFTADTPDPQLFTDVQNLNAFSDEQLTAFVSITLAFLKQGADDPQEALEEFAEENGVNLKALNNTVRGVLFFFGEALKQNLSPEHVRQDLGKLGLDEEKAALLSRQWKNNFVSLSESMIAQTLTVNRLVDMDWKFGVTTASDELNKVGACFLQLKLVVDKGHGKRENVLMELTLPQFYQFLHQMQAASRECQ